MYKKKGHNYSSTVVHQNYWANYVCAAPFHRIAITLLGPGSVNLISDVQRITKTLVCVQIYRSKER